MRERLADPLALVPVQGMGSAFQSVGQVLHPLPPATRSAQGTQTEKHDLRAGASLAPSSSHQTATHMHGPQQNLSSQGAVLSVASASK